jgi:hypothetical protein
MSLKEKLEQLVEAYEAEVAEFAAERELSEEESLEVTAYDFGLDADGVPNSLGNADDIYNDGYNNGQDDGEYGLAVLILQMINDSQAVIAGQAEVASVVKH